MYFPSTNTNAMRAEGSSVPVSAPSILYTLLGGLYTSSKPCLEAKIEVRSFWWRFPVIIACAKMMLLFLHMHPSAVVDDSILIDPILKGSWTLVDLNIPPDGLALSTRDSTQKNHYKALATFCEIDWSVHQKNPSQTSFFDDLRGESPSCQQNSRTVDLYDFMKQVRAFDAQHAAGNEFITPRASPISGMVFHQSRCGSTLAANMLAAFDPPRTRVYSEHFPPITALRACSLVECHDENTHIQLIRDVFYMLGRTPKHENIQHVFFKSNSGGMFIDKFTAAFPDAPWAYLYRDSIEIMQSHFPATTKPDSTRDSNDVPCARNYRNPHQPRFTQQVLQDKNVTYDQLTKTEYCAAHLAGISRSVLHEHERTGRGRFVNYLDMPAAMWETLLPVDFGIALDASMVNRMHQVTGLYSKGGRQHAGAVQEQGNATHPWHSDTLRKRAAASETIHDAVNRFCPDTYEQLESVAKKQRTIQS